MTNRFMDGYDDPWAPTGRYGGKLANWMAQSTPEWVSGIPLRGGVSPYGTSPIEQILVDPLFKRINPEGEKQMEKIDWHKPLRAFKTPGHEVVDAKVYTYKSGKQRVIWVDERVYPVDDQGRAVADVDYGANWVRKGRQIVENVPEEKFFLGLRRTANGIYVLTDDGVPTTTGIMGYWKGLVVDDPHWVVDTRKPAEPPKAIEHDPEDYVTIYTRRDDTFTSRLMTKRVSEAYVSEPGEQVVRVRTTPAPVDTSRYIVLWREGPNQPWKINKFGGGRQEFTWAEAQGGASCYEYCTVKVRD